MKQEKMSAKRIAAELAIYVVILLVCIFIVPRYVIQRTLVDGESMEATLQDKDNLLVDKCVFKLTGIDRFDIVVFYPFGKEDDPEDYFIKRIIGLPGETIQIQGEDIYINGEILEEHYGKDPIDDAGVASDPITLGEDEYFVLGDNREISRDSREFGAVNIKDIAGHAVFRMYPFGSFGPLTNK